MSAFILRSHDSRSAHILTENKHAAHVKVFLYIFEILLFGPFKGDFLL